MLCLQFSVTTLKYFYVSIIRLVLEKIQSGYYNDILFKKFYKTSRK